MPEQPIQKQQPQKSEPSGKKPPMGQGQEKKPTNPKQPTPAQDKNHAFKFEMTYANGGFNNGVEVKPGKDGKIELNIMIYGGGEQKVMKIYPVPANI